MISVAPLPAAAGPAAPAAAPVIIMAAGIIAGAIMLAGTAPEPACAARPALPTCVPGITGVWLAGLPAAAGASCPAPPLAAVDGAAPISVSTAVLPPQPLAT